MITNIDLDLKIAHVHCSVLNNNASQVGQDRFTFPMYYINFVALLLYLFLIELRFICFIWVTLLTKVRRGTMVMCSAGDQRVLIRLGSNLAHGPGGRASTWGNRTHLHTICVICAIKCPAHSPIEIEKGKRPRDIDRQIIDHSL